MIFGRTDLRISLFGAKFDAEADFDTRSPVAPPKPHQIDEVIVFETQKKQVFSESVFLGGRKNQDFPKTRKTKKNIKSIEKSEKKY